MSEVAALYLKHSGWTDKTRQLTYNGAVALEGG